MGVFFQTTKLRCRGVLLKIKAIQEALIFLIDLGKKYYHPRHIPKYERGNLV